MSDALPWLMSAITIYMTILAGNKHRLAWAVGLSNQAIWLAWIIITGTWGLLPMNVALWAVYARNHLRWLSDSEKGSEVAPHKPVTPKYTAAQQGGQLLGEARETTRPHHCLEQLEFVLAQTDWTLHERGKFLVSWGHEYRGYLRKLTAQPTPSEQS